MWIFVIVSGLVAWGIIAWIIEVLGNSKKYLELKPKLDNLNRLAKDQEVKIEREESEVQSRKREIENERVLTLKKMEQAVYEIQKTAEAEVLKEKKQLEIEKENIEKIAKQKSMGFPWLAEAYADYFSLEDLRRAEFLENKKHPAYTTAELVREIKKEKKLLQMENKIVSYKINYFQKLFPWLVDLIAIDENDEIPVRIEGDILEEENGDRVKNFLTPEEYKSLPSVERNQKALDRYLRNRHKSKWAIGRDYEMYIGYLFEKKGYSIEYKGIIDGFDDLGRDLIATKNDETCIIQCKNWAQYKEIHEKHVFQLFGTTMEYWLNNYSVVRNEYNLFTQKINNKEKPKSFREFAKFLNENKLRPIFFTSTSLSARAKKMAAALNIEIMENEPVGDFPRIKCNLNYDQYGVETKIYHLPMDQQYDRTIITKAKGEFYAFTVKEAEDAGFRRAFKHKF